MMRRTTYLAAPLAAAALMLLSAPPGNAAGQTEMGPDHANSICSFSGLNDTPDAEFPEGGRTQNYGQLVRQGVIPASQVRNLGPGTSCNAHIYPYPPGPPPPGQ